MTEQTTKLDVKTLEHVYSLLRDEVVRHLEIREEATGEAWDKAHHKLKAVDDASFKVLKLIWKEYDRMQEA